MNKLKKFFISAFLIFLINIFINSAVLANDLNIYSEAAILIDSNSGNVLYEKNSNTLMYPASTTKVLTTLLALENEAKGRGAELLHLEVRQGNEVAICLYKSFGFTTDGIRKNYYTKPLENAVLMTKRI